MSSARMNVWIAEPPNSSRASSVRTTVKLVLIERPNVCRIEWLTIAGERLAGVAGPVLADPVEHDDRVVDAEADDRQHRGHEQGVDLDPEERAEDREVPDDDDHVVEQRDERRARRTWTSRKRNVIQSRIPSAPTRIRTIACWMRSDADDRADRGQAALVVDRAELLLERRGELADLAAGRRGSGRSGRAPRPASATGSARLRRPVRRRGRRLGDAGRRGRSRDRRERDGLGEIRTAPDGEAAGCPRRHCPMEPAWLPVTPTRAGRAGCARARARRQERRRRGRARRRRRAGRSAWSGCRSSRPAIWTTVESARPCAARTAWTWAGVTVGSCELDLPLGPAGVVDRELQADLRRS